MSGSESLLDTNAIIHLLKGNKALGSLIHHYQLYISFISEIELLGYQGITAKETRQIEAFINDCRMVDINQQIKRKVIQLRKTKKIKLPDAIIAATTLYLAASFVPSDKGFKNITGLTYSDKF